MKVGAGAEGEYFLMKLSSSVRGVGGDRRYAAAIYMVHVPRRI